MITKFPLKSFLVLCISILLSTVMVGSTVTAQEVVQDNSILTASPEQNIQGGSPVPGGPGFISVSTFAFKPYSSLYDLSYNNLKMFNGGTNAGTYIAPVNLPHGATINKVVLFYQDNRQAENLALFVYRGNLFDGSFDVVAGAFPNASSGFGYIEGTIFYPLVNNQLYSYTLAVNIPGGCGLDLALINIRIDYDYPVFLPTVQK